MSYPIKNNTSDNHYNHATSEPANTPLSTLLRALVGPEYEGEVAFRLCDGSLVYGTLANAPSGPGVRFHEHTPDGLTAFKFFLPGGLSRDGWKDWPLPPTAVMYNAREGLHAIFYALEQWHLSSGAKLGELGLGVTIPTPGLDGWELLHDNAGAFYTHAELENAFPETPLDVRPGHQTAFVGTLEQRARLNGQLRAPIDVAVAGSSRSRLWTPASVTVAAVTAGFIYHKTSPSKDGHCVVFAKLKADRRTKDGILSTSAIYVDSDNGELLADICARASRLGIFMAVANSYSDGKTKLDVRRKSFDDFCAKHQLPPDEAIKKLLKSKGIREHNAEGAVISGISEDGDNYVVDIPPLARHRIVVPLLTPVPHDDAGVGERKVRAIVRTFANHLGIHHDDSCADINRIIYLSRRPRGAPSVGIIIGGDVLDWRTFDTSAAEATFTGAAVSSGWRPPTGVDVAFVGDGDRKTPQTDLGLALKASGKVGRNFAVLDFISKRRPQFLLPGRGSRRINYPNGVKMRIVCPHQDLHSDPGNKNDTACVALQGDWGWSIRCHHASCTNLNRYDFLAPIVKEKPCAA